MTQLTPGLHLCLQTTLDLPTCTCPCQAIHQCKQLVVQHFDQGLDSAAADAVIIVVHDLLRPHPAQHVGADSGVVCVGGHPAASQLGQRVSESPASRVNEHLQQQAQRDK